MRSYPYPYNAFITEVLDESEFVRIILNQLGNTTDPEALNDMKANLLAMLHNYGLTDHGFEVCMQALEDNERQVSKGEKTTEVDINQISLDQLTDHQSLNNKKDHEPQDETKAPLVLDETASSSVETMSETPLDNDQTIVAPTLLTKRNDLKQSNKAPETTAPKAIGYVGYPNVKSANREEPVDEDETVVTQTRPKPVRPLTSRPLTGVRIEKKVSTNHVKRDSKKQHTPQSNKKTLGANAAPKRYIPPTESKGASKSKKERNSNRVRNVLLAATACCALFLIAYTALNNFSGITPKENKEINESVFNIDKEVTELPSKVSETSETKTEYSPSQSVIKKTPSDINITETGLITGNRVNNNQVKERAVKQIKERVSVQAIGSNKNDALKNNVASTLEETTNTESVAPGRTDVNQSSTQPSSPTEAELLYRELSDLAQDLNIEPESNPNTALAKLSKIKSLDPRYPGLDKAYQYISRGYLALSKLAYADQNKAQSDYFLGESIKYQALAQKFKRENNSQLNGNKETQ